MREVGKTLIDAIAEEDASGSFRCYWVRE